MSTRCYETLGAGFVLQAHLGSTSRTIAPDVRRCVVPDQRVNRRDRWWIVAARSGIRWLPARRAPRRHRHLQNRDAVESPGSDQVRGPGQRPGPPRCQRPRPRPGPRPGQWPGPRPSTSLANQPPQSACSGSAPPWLSTVASAAWAPRTEAGPSGLGVGRTRRSCQPP